MKKLLTVIFTTLLISTTAFAQENITVEKGQYLQVGSVEENVTVNIHNEQDKPLWKNVEVENIDGVANVLIPLNNPLKIIHVHIVKGDKENVLKVNLTEPHKHQGQHVEFIRPTETEAGRMEYFVCDCGKAFEDRACTIEITEDIDEWAYLTPVPKEEWNGPVAVVERYDGKQVTDPTRPNPTWEQEKVEEFYEQEEIEIQKEIEKRIVVSEDLEVETQEGNEEIKSVAFSVEPVKVEEEPTLWERIKAFLINLFN